MELKLWPLPLYAQLLCPGIYDSSMCQLSPVIVTFCQLPIFDLGRPSERKTAMTTTVCPALSACPLSTYIFMTILMQFSKIKRIFYGSLQECAPLGKNLKAVSTCQPLRLAFICVVYYCCVLFYLRSDFISFIWSPRSRLCVEVYIFICFDS